jgi:hypothetical protein
MSGAGARPLLPRLTPSLASSVSGALAVLAGLLALVVGSSLPSEYQGAFDVVRLPPTGAPTQTAGLSSRLAVKIGSLPSDNQKAWLGVNIQSMELPLALSLGLRNAKGALITETVPNGPAARAGIRPGDIILNFNGNNLEDSTDLRQKVSHTAIDSDVVLEVWRVASPDGDFYAALRRLADGGNAYVMYHLGTMHEAGTGIAKDEREAVRWYQRAANAGSPHAMTSLGLMLIAGRGAAKDQPEGIRLLKGAADRDHPEALRRLAVLMVEGTALTRNLPEAERQLTKSAEAGHVLSMVDLGDMYDARESEQGWGQAAKWYARAADRGNATAMVRLGILQQDGKGVLKDETAAANLYRKAAEDGSSSGMHNLALLYDKGIGVDRRDPELAATLMLQAIDLGDQFSVKEMAQSSRRWSLDFRRAFQRKLRDAGFYEGSIDGSFGNSTLSALSDYINRKKK